MTRPRRIGQSRFRITARANDLLRRGSLLCAALLIAACQAPPPSPRAATAQGDAATLFAPDEVIALVPTAQGARAVRTGARSLGFDLVEDIGLDALDVRMLRFTYPRSYDGAVAIAALEALDRGTTAGVNHGFRVVAAPGADRFDYADTLIAWPPGGCRAQGPVGMLDTGLDADIAPALGGRIVSSNFSRGKAAATRHGTDVASLLMDRRRISGTVVYNAAVVGRSAAGEVMAGVDSLMKGLDWLTGEGVRVVNVSLAGPYNKLLDESIERAVARGMTIVAAAGNAGAGGPPLYPAAFDGVIAVTAVDADLKVYRAASRGRHIDVAAPGVDIRIATADRARFVSGTSMASPFVTLRVAADPALVGQSPATIRRAVIAGAQDLGPPGADRIFGAGLLRAPTSCEG